MPGGPDTPQYHARAQTISAAAVIVGVATLAYANSFPGIFLFDDQASILANRSIQTLWPLGRVLHPPAEAGVGGRPFANLTFALNHALSGQAAWSYHLFNVLLHILCGLTLFGILRRTFAPWRREPGPTGETGSSAALAAAVLWVVHPLVTAAVNYSSQRTELLMALCLLLTLYSFIRAVAAPHRTRWMIAMVLACTVGMASKETMITAPLIILLYDRTFVGGTFRSALRNRWRLHIALAATWMVVAILLVSSNVSGRGAGFGLGLSATDYALTSCRALVRYVKLMLWPTPLVFDYGWDYVQSIAEVWPQVLLAALGVGIAISEMLRRSVVGFLAATFLLLLAPTTSFLPIVEVPIAESRTYLPLAVGITGAVMAVRAAVPRSPVLLALIAIAWLSLTLPRNTDFRTPLTLWSDTVTKAPTNARARNYLGAACLDAGDLAAALREMRGAVALRPAYADAHNNLAIALLRHNRPDEAIAHFESALQLNPQFADAHYNLGEVLLARGDLDGAVSRYTAALSLRPDHARAHNNLSVALLRLGRIDEAIRHAESALRLDPHLAAAHYNLGNAVAAAGRFADAERCFAAALNLDSGFAKAANNLGALRLRAGDTRGAAHYFETALRIQPEYREARQNLELARRAVDAAAPP